MSSGEIVPVHKKLLYGYAVMKKTNVNKQVDKLAG